ncbi:MAG: type II toxin-antitoxin system RelE/ParE family toxin [Acidobacteriota bacterium]
MIHSFRDGAAADLFRERNTRAARRIPQPLWRGVQRKLRLLDAAARLDDLVVPAGNRLEALKGDRVGRHSIRVNDQYRITFRWERGHAYEVSVEDYH